MIPAGAGSAILLWLAICAFALWYLNRPGKSPADQGLKLWGFGLLGLIVLGTVAFFVGSP
jgi:hypothetical protein